MYKFFSFILFFIVLVLSTSCNKTTKIKTIPEQTINFDLKPPAPINLTTNLDDFSLLISSLQFKGEIASKEVNFLENKICTNLNQAISSNKFFKLWEKYFIIYTINLKISNTNHYFKPNKTFISITRKLFLRMQKEGRFYPSLITAVFLVHYDNFDFTKYKQSMFDWMKTSDAIQYENCVTKIKQFKKCRRFLYSGEIFKTLMNQWFNDYIVNLYMDFYFGKNKNLIFTNKITNWILNNIPETEQSFYLNKVVAINLWKGNMKNLVNLANSPEFSQINPYLAVLLKKALSKDFIPVNWEQLSFYINTKENIFFWNKKSCDILAQKFKSESLTCKAYALDNYSFYQKRQLMLETLKLNPTKLSVWDWIFAKNLNLIYKLLYKNLYAQAEKELNFLYKYIRLQHKYFPIKSTYNTPRLEQLKAQLELIRGNYNKGVKILQKTTSSHLQGDNLYDYITVLFWGGKYKEVLKKIKLFKKLPISNYNVYIYFKTSRIESLAYDALGQKEKAKQLRLKKIRNLNYIIKQSKNRDLQINLLMLVANMYMDNNDFITAKQFYQIAMMTNRCGIYRNILIEYLSHRYFKGMFEIYTSLISNKKCSLNEKFYSSLWTFYFSKINNSEKKQIKYIKQILARPLENRWLKVLKDFVLKKITFEDMLSKTQNKGEKTEAYFYAALSEWSNGNTKKARILLKKVISFKIIPFFEYQFAVKFLKLNKQLFFE